MKRTAPIKIASRVIELSEFERLSRGADLGRGWSYELPKSVRLGLDVFHAYDRVLDPQVIEQESRAALERLCEHRGMRAIVEVPFNKFKKQVKGFLGYTDGLCDRALEVLSDSRARRQAEVITPAQEATSHAHDILRDLEAILNEQDEPDFRHSPTRHAYNLARQVIESAYTTHYLNFAPTPTIAPDGDGGLAIEWKAGRRVIRLIVGHNEDTRSYIYRRGEEDHPSQIYTASGEILVEQLRSVFAD